MSRASLMSLGRIGLLLILPLAFLAIPTAWFERSPTVCIIRRVTGKPCPGCGMTRAVSCVMHGRFRQGYRYNKRIVIVMPLLALVWLRELARES
ncbi:MAG TPA: DUF2752 domain-containing protein [Ktedonobacterales bacterium]|nr:DUF2752 domain-containing protein [Ktedonobacterales bacterium]